MDDSISALSPFSLLPPTAHPTVPTSVAALRTMLSEFSARVRDAI